jgi:hypothetical protein
MKQDTDWNTVSISYDPLTLYRLIERTVLAQTEDQYSFATVYDQELSCYSFKQDNMSNPQWYERFNKKVDVSGAIGVPRQHKVFLEYVAQESYTQTFTDLGPIEQQLVRDDAEERYVSYAFLRQIGTQHVNSRWICRTISLQVTIAIPIMSQKMSQKCHTLRAPHSHRRAEEVAVTEAAAAMEKAAIPAPMIRSTGMTRNATSATRKGIQQRIVPRSRVKTMIVPRRALPAASRNSRRIPSPSRTHLLRSTVNLHS